MLKESLLKVGAVKVKGTIHRRRDCCLKKIAPGGYWTIKKTYRIIKRENKNAFVLNVKAFLLMVEVKPPKD